jgi:hypothetical protein
LTRKWQKKLFITIMHPNFLCYIRCSQMVAHVSKQLWLSMLCFRGFLQIQRVINLDTGSIQLIVLLYYSALGFNYASSTQWLQKRKYQVLITVNFEYQVSVRSVLPFRCSTDTVAKIQQNSTHLEYQQQRRGQLIVNLENLLCSP